MIPMIRRVCQHVTLLRATVVVLTVGATAVIYVATNPAPRDTAVRTEGVQQSASSQAGGLTLALSEARFSGTDTLVSFAVEDASGTAKYEIDSASLLLDGFRGGYGDGAFYAEPHGTMRLPPIAGASARPVLTVAAVDRVDAAGNSSRVIGPWSLPISLPDFGTLSRALVVEEVTFTDAVAGGIVIASTGVLSVTSLELTYTVPNGLLQLRLPQLLQASGGSSVLPFRDRDNGDGTHTSSYVASAFSAVSQIEFGPFAEQVEAHDTARVSLSGEALSSIRDSAGIHPVPILGTIDGNPDLVVDAAISVRPERASLLLLVLAGNWTSRPSVQGDRAVPTWEVTDSTGRVLSEQGWQENFSTDSTGKITNGTTTFFLEFVDSSALRAVTVRTTKKAEVISGPWIAHR